VNSDKLREHLDSRYSVLCDYMFRLDHPDMAPKDLLCTSPVARERALEVIALLVADSNCNSA